MARHRLRSRWALGDTASGQMIGLIIAMAVFVGASGTLLQFVIHPPGASTASLDRTNLQSVGNGALSVLLNSAGYPSSWGATAASADAMTRLGLLKDGSSFQIDAAKFGALARGKYAGGSATNGYIDYNEAVRQLGLDGYAFHLRAGPSLDPYDGHYGLGDIGTYHIAYLGSGAHPSEATTERAILASELTGFTDATPAGAGGTGDAYVDSLSQLRTLLLPELGGRYTESVLNAGTGTATDFKAASASDIATALPRQSNPSGALAMATSTGAFAYADSRELRETIATIDMSSVTATGTVSWNEHVNTGGDANDYGYLEASPDAGKTWYALTNTALLRSVQGAVDTLAYSPRAATISVANCAPCLQAPQVLLALHWIADGNGVHGTGWIVDDVKTTNDAATLISWRTFDTRAYDLVILGSDVDQTVLNTADVRTALADYASAQGGSLLALGGGTSTAWLAPLYHNDARDSNAVVASPDATNALLNSPNELQWQGYVAGARAWDFSASNEATLFQQILTTSPNHVALGASTLGALGPTNSSLILTAYQPFAMAPDEAARFFANMILHSRYMSLFAEVGPAPAPDAAVGSVTRSALVDRSGGGDFTQLSLTIYVWHANAAGGAVAALSPPTAPTSFAANGAGPIALSWSAPASNGGSAVTSYQLYRGSSYGTETILAALSAANTTFSDANVQTGVTYFYNLTATNAIGASSSTPDVQATASNAPSAPTSPLAIGTLNQIALTWGPPTTSGGTNVTAYKIYRGTSAGSESILATIGSNMTYVDAGLPNGALRYYKISAVNGAGEGAFSTEVFATTFNVPLAPGAPVVTPGLNQLQVAWTAPGNGGTPITGYKLYAASTSGAETLLQSLGPNTLTYTETPLANGATRYYEIVATNAIGDGPFSPEGSGTTFSTSGPPTLLVATGGVGSISLSWQAPVSLGGTPLTGYKIYAGATAGTETLLAQIGTNTSFVDAGLAAGQIKFYKVTAANPAGESLASNEATATTVTAPTPPLVLVATSGAGQISLSWSPPASNGGSAITGYKIYAGATTGSEVLLATIGTNTSYVDAGLATLQTKFYKVTAVNAVGESLASNEATATTFAPPGPPLLPAAVAGASKIDLSWNVPATNGGSAISAYKIYRGTSSGTETLLAVSGTNTTFSDATLGANATRYYKITAVNAVGESVYSTEVSATTFSPPWAPTALIATPHGLATNDIDLHWVAPSNTGGSAITGYKVYRSTSSGTEVLVTTGNCGALGNVLTCRDNLLSGGTLYYYKVAAVNAYGTGAMSNESFAAA